MARPRTRDELIADFQLHALALARYWAELPDAQALGKTPEEKLRWRCEGVTFSLLVMLDGGADVGPFMVIPIGSKENAEWAAENDEECYTPYEHLKRMPKAAEEMDLAGSLHETLHRLDGGDAESARRIQQIQDLLGTARALLTKRPPHGSLPRLSPAEVGNFQTLQQAVRDQRIALMRCTNRLTGQHVSVICAVNPGPNEEIEFVPLAKLFDGNPYDEVDSPLEEPAKDGETVG